METKDIQNDYSSSDNPNKLSIMNDLMSIINLSNKYKVFRVVDNKYSIVMNENEI